ncbi:nucleoside recognition domain-containing protein [Paenibacillus crassostreae]|uniref:Nucleoside transporter/FeoB GTPase Gate domain-containing protein n=1 Tax=Paenibacillus crassostreae TaxID=1763538 RepID=A0A167FQ20_9BACL|nr:nucleoside recognition domain-containing protein [Paenibacillus crassostreae]AOZ94179.1 hypothetical protein LPB68_19605 [Paenibacillus crassostreae]OAB76785.1 hypothetical protein PNBC_05135 [Paenibacillus crassostreae]
MFKHIKYLFSAPAASLMLGLLSFLLVIGIVSSPEQTFQASLQGLTLWWHIVFPSLLPFLVLSEMLIAYGLVHGIGVLLEPLMRRVFALPGIGGWALTMGMTAGFPGGAQSTLQLVQQGDLTPREAERLTWLSHFCNPMTIILVIGIGLLQQPSAGYWLLSIHWISGILAFLTITSLGNLVKHKRNEPSITARIITTPNSSLLRRVRSAIHQAHIRDGRSFGKLLGESVSNAVQTLMVVGGYIIIMAVMIHLISSYIIPGVSSSYIAGLVELHLGAKALTTITTLTPIVQWSLLSFILGWSGLTAILQSITPLMNKGVRWFPFIIVRLLHGTYAFTITFILWNPLKHFVHNIQPAFFYWPNYASDLSQISGMWSHIPLMLGWQGFILISLLLISWLIVLVTTTRRSP